ncbi:zinc-binding dehydrogenase [Streptomyces sp. NPDC058268]|uniref:zinc-binding dehydrogenase n=1 Tax=Streptomyces sp. NPDC058268 TaxID=3346413 RepID=UPI0036EE1284
MSLSSLRVHSHGVRSLEPAALRCRISWAVGSAAKLAQAKEFGFDEVVLREDVSSAGEFDVVIDMVGGPARRASLERLAPLGRLVVMGNASNADDVTFSANELSTSPPCEAPPARAGERRLCGGPDRAAG